MRIGLWQNHCTDLDMAPSEIKVPSKDYLSANIAHMATTTLKVGGMT